jgi:hypothetical protein
VIEYVCNCWGLSNMKYIMNVVCVERKMNENNVIELWLLALEYESCDNDCYEYLYSR